MKIKQKIKNYLDPEEKGYVSPCDVLRFIKHSIMWCIFIACVLTASILCGLIAYDIVLGGSYIFQWYDSILLPIVGAIGILILCLIWLLCMFIIFYGFDLIIKTVEYVYNLCNKLYKYITRKTKMCKIKLIKLK